MHTAVWPMREVVTRAFRKSGSSTRVGGRPFLIIASRGETIPDNHLVPTFYKLTLGRCSHKNSLTVVMGVFHRLYLMYRHPHECLHNLQLTSGCVLPMRSLLETKSVCLSSCALDFCLHFQETFSMRTTICW
jgi:hypothetical protein